MSTLEITPQTTEAEKRERRSRRTAQLLARAQSATGVHRKRLLDQVVVENMPVARAVALRYRGRGLAQEDLEQVAQAALVRCVHAFDPGAADDLLTYAVPSIRGEVLRHFRDNGWMVRPPRRIQEIQSRVVAKRDELADQHGSVDASVIAEALDLPEQDVCEALTAQGCFRPTSLQTPVADVGTPLGDLLPQEPVGDDDFERAETRAVLEPLLRGLDARERRLIGLRFFQGASQSEIAAEYGVSQAQVSRQLTKVLSALRNKIGELDGCPAPAHAA